MKPKSIKKAPSRARTPAALAGQFRRAAKLTAKTPSRPSLRRKQEATRSSELSKELTPSTPRGRGPSSISRARQKALLQLSPFELKDELIKLAEVAERENVAQFLNAGRGN